MKTKKESTSKLSTSVPAQLKPMIRLRAAQLDLTVSQYIRWLVKNEMGPNPLKVSDGDDVNTES